MCGRFSQARSWPELVALYGITTDCPATDLPARYNIAPGERIAIVRRPADGVGRELVRVRWGLIPFWAKDEAIGARTINARAETVAEKPSFRAAFRSRRCLVLSDGFYEWQRREGRKQPFFITLAADQPFAFAGLWERWTNPAGEVVESATIIVTAANAALAPVHDRMPVILEPSRFDAWLDPKGDLRGAKAMLVPFAGQLVISPVSSRVNSVRNDDAACRAPLTTAFVPAGPA